MVTVETDKFRIARFCVLLARVSCGTDPIFTSTPRPKLIR